MIKPTSRKAYEELTASGNDERHLKMIEKRLKRRKTGVSRRWIEKVTGLRANQVSGRVNEGIKQHRLKINGLVKCPITGNEVEAVFYGGSQ